jgi:hypothetical protein
MHAVISWWLDLLLHHGLIGPVIAVGLAALVVLMAGSVVIWSLVGLKFLAREFATGFRRGWRRTQRRSGA